MPVSIGADKTNTVGSRTPGLIRTRTLVELNEAVLEVLDEMRRCHTGTIQMVQLEKLSSLP